MPEKILVMDEQEEIRLHLSDILTGEGYTVFTAMGTPDGLELFQTEAPDLVFADANLPIGSCLEMLKEIKRSRGEVDLIVLAAADDQELAIGWLEKGVYDFLPKPMTERGMIIAAVRRALQKRRLMVQNSRLVKELEQMTMKDPITGLYNHRFMHKCLLDEIVRSARYNHQFLLIMVDIDHFKNLNAVNGRNYGDFVLTRMARLLEDNLRLTDSTFRCDGGKFMLLLPETRKDQAIRVAERILESIRYHDFSWEGGKARVTISMGAAEFPLDARDAPTLIGLAGERLAYAIQSGRDCFNFEMHEALPSDV
jgi:two-component system cell cycle response regulator